VFNEGWQVEGMSDHDIVVGNALFAAVGFNFWAQISSSKNWV
jgi:hypothetical protein